MNKKIVRYNNDLNSVTFGSFKEKELDLFFSICFKLKELGTDEVEISFKELKELSDYSNRNVRRFINDLESTYVEYKNEAFRGKF
ncbi:MAG: RepB family plasmid replication initiator protein [Cetobacterium sp.]